ncbi:MAG: methionyl-tRNA formyltransferase [Gemmatimonadota bacterium]|nr:methionyl-tRNA formyltransferase [Gemmatimonadota bacterium]MDH4349715.1 methionyl-tRNA formyltransferase [Gemmatimonadota bacterium]MDH5196917.1 methionyl-tRNA formyltransferase [Gemmatimonadota bacterium]
MRLAFFGTPTFAVPALRALIGEGFDLQVVVTQPDRPQGRSRSRLVSPPVKEVAVAEGIPVLQPEQPGDGSFVDALRGYAPTLGIVIAYGHILKPALLALPARGMINVHASLLPALRGAAPIAHAVMEGLEETGVTIMQMDEGMDTGPILHQVPTPLATDETAGELEVRLAELGALALIEALALMEADVLESRSQNEARATYAPKLSVEAARIPWNESTARVGRLIRGLDPRPGAWTELRDRRIKLFGPRPAGAAPAGVTPGEIVETDPALLVATGDGLVQILDVQPDGKTRLAASEWVRGRGAHPGDRFS